MTVSFHHAFRGGDLTVNMVMDVIAEMGSKDLTLASSSLSDCHAPLIGHIRQGVVTRIYISDLRGPLTGEISRDLLAEPVQIHSHGGRVYLVRGGELNIDVALFGVPSCDEFGNTNGYTGRACCGSLGYTMVDVDNAKQIVIPTEELLSYPHNPASIEQDQVSLIIKVDHAGDAAKIGTGATRMATNPYELLIARNTVNVIVNSGYLRESSSMQTDTSGVLLVVTRFLGDKMHNRDIHADFAFGGITVTMVDLHEKGLIRKLLDVQSFDSHAAQSLARNPNHIEIDTNQYTNRGSKGTSVDRLDAMVLSALEVNTQFSVNVLTDSDGILHGASGGHCDTAITSTLSIIVVPPVCGRISALVDNVLTRTTPGSSVDILVTDHGIAVNPTHPELAERLQGAGTKVVSIEWLRERARLLTGEPQPIEFTDRIVAAVCYRDDLVIDAVHQVKEQAIYLFPELANHHAVSIPELLVSWGEKQARRHIWLKRHPVPLVSFTVVVPGPIKDSEATRRISSHGVTALHALTAKQDWQIQERATLVSASRPEGTLSIAAPARGLKLVTTEPEHSHPLGWLQDIDVLTLEGEVLSRHDCSLPPRRCLLCEQSITVCVRGKTHRLADLLSRMEVLLNDVDACNVN